MPRKSDASRRSDVSMAKFVLVDDNEAAPVASASAAVAAAPPAPAYTVQPTKPPVSAEEMETDRPSESPAAPGDKDKKENKESSTMAIEDLNLPKSIITRLAKGVLPPNTQIQANAILAMTKSATVFINHLANAANQHTLDQNKKTIMPDDVLDALEDVEFPQFREALQAEFKKFNETQTTKRNTYRRRVAAAKRGQPFPPTSADPDASTMSAASASASAAAAAAAADTSMASAAPRSKKQKTNGPADDSAMDVDGRDEDASDAETESDAEEDEEEDDEEAAEEEDDEDDDEGEGRDDEEMRDALEERDDKDEEDEALDGNDSD